MNGRDDVMDDVLSDLPEVGDELPTWQPPAHLEIEHVDPKALHPSPDNPRVLSPDAKKKLKRGIVAFGLVDPILVRRSDLQIVGGHSRHQCALELGLRQVPVVFLDNLDDDRMKALMVLLNNTEAQGVWDNEKLADILAGLDGNLFDTTLTGFDERQIEQMSALSGSADILPKYAAPSPTPHLMYGIYDIPMSPDEDERFKKLVQEYVAEKGVLFGFVSYLMRRIGKS